VSGPLRALDLFCGAGGASMGLHRAGFEVTGVDIAPQPRYPFAFVQGDALAAEIGGFDFVWASPPCQRYSMYSRNLGTAESFPDLVAVVRSKLVASGLPYVIENVVGAPLVATFVLCGTMFGLKVLRHRLFETSWPMNQLLPPCSHRGDEIPVYGNGTPQWHRQRLGRNIHVAEQRTAMDIDWMTRDEITQAIPPAYSEFLGRAVKRALGLERAAVLPGVA
jgi:DNA (cytosine-5)-methyltransferase 1